MAATVLYWANRYLNASKRRSVFRATSCSPTKMIRPSPPADQQGREQREASGKQQRRQGPPAIRDQRLPGLPVVEPQEGLVVPYPKHPEYRALQRHDPEGGQRRGLEPGKRKDAPHAEHDADHEVRAKGRRARRHQQRSIPPGLHFLKGEQHPSGGRAEGGGKARHGPGHDIRAPGQGVRGRGPPKRMEPRAHGPAHLNARPFPAKGKPAEQRQPAPQKFCRQHAPPCEGKTPGQSQLRLRNARTADERLLPDDTPEDHGQRSQHAEPDRYCPPHLTPTFQPKRHTRRGPIVGQTEKADHAPGAKPNRQPAHGQHGQDGLCGCGINRIGHGTCSLFTPPTHRRNGKA